MALIFKFHARKIELLALGFPVLAKVMADKAEAAYQLWRLLPVLALVLITGCATTQYTWRAAPEKNVEVMGQESVQCERWAHVNAITYYTPKTGVRRTDKSSAYVNCMLSKGHALDEKVVMEIPLVGVVL